MTPQKPFRRNRKMTMNELNLVKSHLRELTAGEVELMPEHEDFRQMLRRTRDYDGPSEIDEGTYRHYLSLARPRFQLGSYFTYEECLGDCQLFWRRNDLYFMRWLHWVDAGILLELAGIEVYNEL
jgi:hypothetical protein